MTKQEKLEDIGGYVYLSKTDIRCLLASMNYTRNRCFDTSWNQDDEKLYQRLQNKAK
jgi:hypothetical protein